MRRKMFALGLAVSFVLAGCTSGQPGPGSTSPSPSLDTEDYAEQYVQRKAACIEMGGGIVQFTGRFGFEAGPGPGMNDATMAALMARCSEEAGPTPQPRTDRETLTRVYRWSVDTYDCLLAQGYQPSPPPNLEVFLETYWSEDAWHPWNGIEEVFKNANEAAQLREACPPNMTE